MNVQEALKAWDEATANSSGVFAALVEEVASLKETVRGLQSLVGDIADQQEVDGWKIAALDLWWHKVERGEDE